MTITAHWWDAPIAGWSDAAASPQQRGRATRHALMLEAARSFDARGYDATSLSDILAASGRTKGALYFHFASKQQLAEAVVRELFASWEVVRDEIAARGLDPLRTLLVETDAYVGRWSYDPVVRGASRAMAGAALLAESHSSSYTRWEAGTAAHLRAAHAHGLLKPDVDPDRASRLIVAASAGHHSFADIMPSAGTYFERMTDTWLGVLPAIAIEPCYAEIQASGWEHRPAPDPDAYARARAI